MNGFKHYRRKEMIIDIGAAPVVISTNNIYLNAFTKTSCASTRRPFSPAREDRHRKTLTLEVLPRKKLQPILVLDIPSLKWLSNGIEHLRDKKLPEFGPWYLLLLSPYFAHGLLMAHTDCCVNVEGNTTVFKLFSAGVKGRRQSMPLAELAAETFGYRLSLFTSILETK